MVYNFQPLHKVNSIIFVLSSDLTFLHLVKSYVFLQGSGDDVTLPLAHHFFFTKKVFRN